MALIMALLIGLSAVLSFALYLRGVVNHRGGAAIVLFGSWTVIGSVAAFWLLAWGLA